MEAGRFSLWRWPIWDGEPIRVIEEKSIGDEITGFATTHYS